MSLPIADYSLNGISIGEAGLQAAIAGHFGVPFVYLAGDAHACREMEALIPGIVTVAVKVGTGEHGAVTLPPKEAREKIRAGAAEAMERVGEVAPFKVDYPLVFREQLKAPGFDEWNPPAHSVVLDSRTREVAANDILDLCHKLYAYDPAWQPLSYAPLIGK